MDPHRFDDLTRALATTPSRRQFLKTLAGGAAGGLLAFLGVGEVAADDTCKPNGKKCRKNAQCCSGICANGTCVTPTTTTTTTTTPAPTTTTTTTTTTTPICVPDGGPCSSSGDCCPGLDCDKTAGGICVLCIPPGHEGCSSSSDCCPGYVCDEGGICVDEFP